MAAFGRTSLLDYNQQDPLFIEDDYTYPAKPPTTGTIKKGNFQIDPPAPEPRFGLNNPRITDYGKPNGIVDYGYTYQQPAAPQQAPQQNTQFPQMAPQMQPAGGYGAPMSMGGAGGGGGGYDQLAQMMAQAMGGQQQAPAAPKPPEPKKTFDQLNPNGTPSGANYKDARDPLTFTGGGYPAQDTQHGQGVIRDMLRNPQPSPYGAPPTGQLPGSKAPAAAKEEDNEDPKAPSTGGKKPAKKGSAWPTVRARSSFGGGKSSFGGRFGR